MIFLECIGSRASLSAIKGVNQAFARFAPFFISKNECLGMELRRVVLSDYFLRQNIYLFF